MDSVKAYGIITVAFLVACGLIYKLGSKWIDDVSERLDAANSLSSKVTELDIMYKNLLQNFEQFSARTDTRLGNLEIGQAKSLSLQRKMYRGIRALRDRREEPREGEN